jgi:hypothetical protein
MRSLLEKFPCWVILLISNLMVAGLGYLDYLTGDYSILIFYLIPVTLVAWLLDRRSALFIVFTSGMARVLSDYYSYSSPAFKWWNSFQDTIFLLMIGLLVALLKKLLSSR